jgi:S-formylglutathione hydrolase FrmB
LEALVSDEYGDDMMQRTLGFSFALLLLAPLPSGAVSFPCGPYWPVTVPEYDRSRVETLSVDGFKVNVLLPPGYADDGKRYPVLYLLHGAGWGVDLGPEIYLAYTTIQNLTAQGGGVIAVMPATTPLGFYTDWLDGTQHWETYHIDVVIPYIDAHYRTLADRSHRAVAGESMGGYGAMHYAARHPDLFVAAGSFSGWLDITYQSPAEELLGPPLLGGQAAACYGGNGQGAWGDPLTNDIAWHNHNPPDLAGNLGGTSIYFAVGNGVPCDPQEVMEFPAIYPALETVLPMRNLNVSFADALQAAGVAHTAEFRECGIHTFRYFQQYLDHFWPQMLNAFGSAPTSFDYRTADPSFAVWGWQLTADAKRAAEFLEISDASDSGLGLTGSGLTTVATAGYFAEGQVMMLVGAVEPSAVADTHGRITFTVDLGPPHENQQYTLPARVLEAAGGYFRSQTVNFVTPR